MKMTIMIRHILVIIVYTCLLLTPVQINGIQYNNNVATKQKSMKVIMIQNTKTRKEFTETITTTSTPSWMKIRGGDLGQVSGKTLAQTLAVLASFDAIAGSLAPITSLKWMGIEITGVNLRRRLAYHYIHGIGASAATVAVSLFLANCEGMEISKALGYGYLIRLFSMTFLLGQTKFIGMNGTMFALMWTMVAAVVVALLLPNLNWSGGMNLTKVVSLLLGVHGFFLYCEPDIFVHKGIGQDKRDEMTTNMASINGGYMAVSGIVTYLLANGVNPVRVAGYASLAYMPILLKLIAAIPVDKMLGIDTRAIVVMITTVLAMIAVGTLHDE